MHVAQHQFLQLSTVDQNHMGQAQKAVEILLDHIDKSKNGSSKAYQPEEPVCHLIPTKPIICESSLCNATGIDLRNQLIKNIYQHLSNNTDSYKPYGFFDIEKQMGKDADWFINALDHTVETGSLRGIEAYELICVAAKPYSFCKFWLLTFKYSLIRYLEVILVDRESVGGQAMVKTLMDSIYVDVEFEEEIENFGKNRQDEYLIRLQTVLAACNDIDEVLQSMNQFFEVANIGHAFIALNNRLYGGNASDLVLVQQSSNGERTLCTGEIYPATRVLPRELRSNLGKRFIVTTPLRFNSEEYGYLGIDPASTHALKIASIADCISIALQSRCLVKNLETQATQLKQHNKVLEHVANTDYLTGISNRPHFEGHLDNLIESAKADASQFALFYIDLDGFKSINDSLGHKAGDQFLVKVADTLSEMMKDRGFFARLGGDEFAVLASLQNTDDKASLQKQIESIATKLNKSLTYCSRQDINSTDVTASIGIAVYPKHGTEAETLLKHADIAMYHSKLLGKNQFQVFSSSMIVAEQAESEMDQAMRQGLARNEFLMVYQPRYDLNSGNLTGFESLMRWNPENSGDTTPPGPDVFIELAEKTGFIRELGQFALNESCKQAREWMIAGCPVTIAVNLSVRQLQDPDIVDQVQHFLDKHQLPAKYLEIEVTETAAMTNVNDSIGNLNALRTLGVDISLDDFGTGYSSMNYLKQLPITNLKIDRSFVKDIDKGSLDVSVDATIVKALVALGHNLGYSIVAEGVETEDQFEFLKSLGCDEAQGYYLSKPLDSQQATLLLKHPMAYAA